MKRFFAVLMVIILFSAFMKSALASEKRLLLSETEDIERKMNQKAIENEKQINVLLESLVHRRMKELEDGNDKTYSNISKENSSTIELKLKLLGVKSISGKEVNDLVSRYSKNTEKQYAKYVRDEKVKWFTYTTSYLYGGTVYSV